MMQKFSQSASSPSDASFDPPQQVATNIWRIPLPIPFPLKSVNIYALVGKEGTWSLIDTGMGTPAARSAFVAALAHTGLELERLQSIVLTHHHPDHVGLSGELQELTHVPVYMHALDKAAISFLASDGMPERFKRVSLFLSQHGLPPTELWFSRVDPSVLHSLLRVPPQDAVQTVSDGSMLELAGSLYSVLWTPGHSDGQICLYREQDQVLLSADHVLPRITPNIGLYNEYDRPNPLEDYLSSLARVAPLPASVVLPGHGDPFSDLSGRVSAISAHHTQREQQILTLLSQLPQHATQLTATLFGDRLQNDEAWRMAVAEVVAHLEHMRSLQVLTRALSPDGLLFYYPAS